MYYFKLFCLGIFGDSLFYNLHRHHETQTLEITNASIYFPYYIQNFYLTSYFIDGKTWVDKSVYQDQHNSSQHRSLGKERAPFEVFFGKKCNFDLSLLSHEIWENERDGNAI